MKKYFLCILAVFFLLLPSAALALPELQLYLEGGSYNTLTESWELSGVDTARLWVIGDVGAKGNLYNVMLYAAYAEQTGAVTITLNPTTTGGYGGFVDPSTPVGVGGLSTETETGTTPPKLSGHGIYGAGVAWSGFELGNFTLKDSPIADFQNSLPSPEARKLGQINVYEVVVEGLLAGGLHFDITGYYLKNKTQKDVFGPYSHDADAGFSVSVPESSTMLLLGFGLMGLAGFGRKKLFNRS